MELAIRPGVAQAVLDLVSAFAATADFFGIVDAVEVLTPRMLTRWTQLGDNAIRATSGANPITPPFERGRLAHSVNIAALRRER